MAAMENYVAWVKGLSNVELNKEIEKNRRNRDATTVERNRNAWQRLLTVSLGEANRRDNPIG